jgi:hypothetical protein
MMTPERKVGWIDGAIAVSAAAFVAVLALAAWLDPSIRVLHAVEAVPYVVGAALCLQRRKFGSMLAGVGGAFWLRLGGFLTTFFRNGFERLAMLLRTGSVDRVDILIAAPAAVSTGGLVLFSVLGYARRQDRSWKDLRLLLAAALLVPAFFVLIFAAFAPQYLSMFRGIY